jgi:tetratricopeptide (TPR) repeat protein
MAFGFGFNKTKVLSAAEKCVQQGKLLNAIVEYEKIVKEDPKDLTVLNTIGDLYARLGHADRAGSYFRRVGDAYAADGFTVKAIAMYKKLTKLNPAATDCILKLAELYTQQGLYNDARSQYVQVADQYMKAGELEQASRIFQKMLELDPENTAMQSKLAELYVKLGKKTEARDIFARAADSLYGRGALEAADDALGRVLKLEPGNARALTLRAQVALDSGDADKAIKHLEQIPQIDSLPDALAALLRAYLVVGQLEAAEPVARKLLTVHNDLSGIHAYADALISSGACEDAIRVYHQYADRLLAADPAGLAEVLRATIGRVKANPAALELLREVFEKSGDTTHIAEITELLAQALVQSGQLEKARDLYSHLAEVEPQNPLHQRSYKQIVARLGEDAVARPLSREEGAQAFMADELEFTAPTLDQHFPDEINAAVQAALTDSELFDSYNLPAKAIAPLEAILAKAPQEVRLNQRLASLYARAERFDDAAHTCAILQKIYADAGFADQSRQYGEMAAKYAERAEAEAPAPAPAEAAVAAAPAPVTPPAEMEVAAETPAPAAPEFAVGPAEAVTEFPTEAAPPTFEVPAAPPPPPAAAATAHELDLSSEWEQAFVAEAPPPPAPAIGPAAQAPAAPEFAVEAVEEQPSPAAELIEEARFYLAQSMWDVARNAIARCEAAAPAAPELAELKQQLAAASVAAVPAEVPAVEVVEEAAAEAAPEGEAKVSAFVFDASALGLPPSAPATPVPPEAVAAAPPPSFEEVPPAPVAESAAEITEIPVAMEAPAPAAPAAADVLRSFAADLEEALPADFGAPPPKAAPVVPKVAERVPPAARVAVPVAAAAPPPVAAAPALAAAAAAPAPEPAVTFDSAASSALSDIFAEFKEDVEESAGKAEDPETHYNLGVAFKEMGLLDEAIGELQKVCHAIDHGHAFAQVMQAYTWLAQCFVEKGVPEAGIRWYEKALKLPADDESRTALHYELACAYEAAGNRQAALSHFMEVYGTNIDYRDVAERIKALKS